MLAAGAAETLRRDDSRGPGGPPGLTGVARVKDGGRETARVWVRARGRPGQGRGRGSRRVVGAGGAKSLRRDDSRAPGGPPGITGVARVKDGGRETARVWVRVRGRPGQGR